MLNGRCNQLFWLDLERGSFDFAAVYAAVFNAVILSPRTRARLLSFKFVNIDETKWALHTVPVQSFMDYFYLLCRFFFLYAFAARALMNEATIATSKQT